MKADGIDIQSQPARPAAMTRVLVVDDHDLVRRAVSAVLDTAEDVSVIGTCADGTEAVAMTAAARPDVVVMDLFMPGLGGLAATRQILAGDPHPRVVVLTASRLGRDVRDVLAAGASACVFKDAGIDVLIAAVRGL
jgi:DNA-binding NarL/FixJ family response regulator